MLSKAGKTPNDAIAGTTPQIGSKIPSPENIPHSVSTGTGGPGHQGISSSPVKESLLASPPMELTKSEMGGWLTFFIIFFILFGFCNCGDWVGIRTRKERRHSLHGCKAREYWIYHIFFFFYSFYICLSVEWVFWGWCWWVSSHSRADRWGLFSFESCGCFFFSCLFCKDLYT